MTPAQPSFFHTAVVPWLGAFCAERDFLDKKGRTAVARALNLLGGHMPKTKAEREFQAALWAEVERRKLVIPNSNTPPIKGNLRA